MDLYEKLAKEYFDMELEFPVVKSEIAIEKAVMKMMIHYDQMPRNDCPGYEVHCEATVAYVDSLNYLYLQKLYNKKGDWFYECNQKAYWLVILHNTQWQRYWMFENMKTELEKGNIPVNLYVNLVNRSHGNNDSLEAIYPKCYDEQLWQFNGKYYFEKLQEDKAKIDSTRQAVYFDMIDDQRTKLIYVEAQSKKEFRFYYQRISMISGMPDEMLKKWLMNFEEIEETILPPVDIN